MAIPIFNDSTYPAEMIAAGYDSSIVVRRWAASMTDLLLLALALLLVVALPNELQPWALALWALGVGAYYLVLEWRCGATVGKILFKLRVIGAGGGSPTFQQATIRTLTRLIEVNPLLIGGIPAGIVVLCSKKRQRLGDMAAQTFVLKCADLPRLQPLAHTPAPMGTPAPVAGVERSIHAPPTAPLTPTPGSSYPDARPSPIPTSPWRDDPGARFLLPTGRSGKAIAAGYLGLFALLGLPAPFAILVGVLALRDLRAHPQKLGRGRAVFGIVMGVLGTAGLLVAILVSFTPASR
jgi:uncharacterized RDD family membrane protein YckC